MIIDNKDINAATAVLKSGGTVLYPTDTVWGLGCDATNSLAVEKLYALKQRRHDSAMLVLVPDIDMVCQYVRKAPEIALQLMEISDKPLTVILSGAEGVSSAIIADDGSLGLRLVRHEYCRRLLQSLKRPIVSTSANISGQPSPQSFDEISDTVVKNVDYVTPLKYAGAMSGKASSVIKILPNGEFTIIRH
jgi:L-threonylcarbamoyladenylate synthase